MVWIKAFFGLRCWMTYDFDRKSIEHYFTTTFVYQTYETLNNILLFSLQPTAFGEWVLPNIIFTILIGCSITYGLYSFTKFHEH